MKNFRLNMQGKQNKNTRENLASLFFSFFFFSSVLGIPVCVNIELEEISNRRKNKAKQNENENK